MVNDGDHGGLVLGRMGYVGQVGYDLCGSGFGLVGGGGLISIGVMQWRGSGGATTWVVGVAAWVWFLTVVFSVFFFFFLVVLMVDYGLLVVVVVVVVSGVCCIAMVVIVVLEQKERERKNK